MPSVLNLTYFTAAVKRIKKREQVLQLLMSNDPPYFSAIKPVKRTKESYTRQSTPTQYSHCPKFSHLCGKKQAFRTIFLCIHNQWQCLFGHPVMKPSGTAKPFSDARDWSHVAEKLDTEVFRETLFELATAKSCFNQRVLPLPKAEVKLGYIGTRWEAIIRSPPECLQRH